MQVSIETRYGTFIGNDRGECHPVIIFIHGGGFNSGSVKDSSFDGYEYAKRGVILVTINYRVGVLGYLTHEEIFTVLLFQ